MDTDPAQQIKDFYADKPDRTFRKGETIVLPDAATLPPISYIEKGIVEQYDITKDGEKVIVNILKPGAFFPASSAMNHTMNSFFFEAAEEATIRQALATDVGALLRTNPAITYDLLQRVYRGLDGVLHKLSASHSQTARQRLLTELNIHAQRFGSPVGDGTTLLAVTAERLAHQTGLSRETVSRELKKLENEAVLTISRAKIIVRTQLAALL